MRRRPFTPVCVCVCVCAPLDMSALTSACFQDPAFLVKRQYVELAQTLPRYG